MKRISTGSVQLALVLVGMLLGDAALAAERKESSQDDLANAFLTPPKTAQAWCYWWWLNGAASKEGITRDFEEMKKQGIGGALLFDAGEAKAEAPRGPHFMSPAWRELYKHAVREADRCGIVLDVNLCSGWNAGGPWVTPEHAAKKIVGAATVVKGPGRVSVSLPQPEKVQGFYQDIAVLGWRDGMCQRSQMLDLTKFVDAQGRLAWVAPAGVWNVLRVGCTLHGNMTKCVGSGPAGLEIDTMSAAAMDAHFAETGAKLIADAGPLVGKTLQYFHIDSWELGQPTWTPKMREEFQKRRGYDPLLYLPALLDRTVDDPETTKRFLADYRRTAADLVAANYYGRFRELAVKGGLRGTHPESGGPFFNHWIDALQCEGINDVPMGEFWKRNAEPQGPISAPPQTNPTVKQAACAAHIYGKPVCQAEAFTSFGCDWIDDPWSMKDIGDEAFCHGLTRNVLCFWVHQPRLDAKPGCQWAHVGTHFDPNITWWNMSGAWLTYLARCQYLLRQGHFVADFAYLQSEDIPGFIAPRDKQQPLRPAGFDYDVLNAEALLTRAAAKDGRLVLPDGMSYRYLVLPHGSLSISPPVLRKIKELAEGGVTIIEAKGRTLAEVVKADGLPPDIEFRQASPQARLDWIHRRAGEVDIYFVANLASVPATAEVLFRTAGKQPELWDAVTGEIRNLTEWQVENGRTAAPLAFAPRQNWFVVFRKTAQPGGFKATTNFPVLKPVAQIVGPWKVAFDPKWGGPKQVAFEKLDDWSQRLEEGIKYYSGTATYRNQFTLAQSNIKNPQSKIYLDLGSVKNVARVKLNGRDLGVVWTAPWHVEVTGVIRPGVNDLEIEVANLWPNRLIGDAGLPKEKRLTLTNVRTYDTLTHEIFGCPICTARKTSGQPATLLSSGLLGPVTLRLQDITSR